MAGYRLAFTGKTGESLVSERIYPSLDEASEALRLLAEQPLVGAAGGRCTLADADLSVEPGLIEAD